jgi:predicted short-subunit dehydrogenase-like oxidoreductase (DUF2520 family)
MTAEAKPPFAVVGCGRVGRALAWRLACAGYPAAGFVSRTLASAGEASRAAGGGPFSDRPGEIVSAARLVFITTPDDAIAAVCAQLAGQGALSRGAVVLHCSGLHPSTILAPAAAAGASVGSIHPLQSFAGLEAGVNPFAGVAMAVEGDGTAVARAEAVAAHLGGVCHRIRTAGKVFYHAGAVAASNYLVALLELSLILMRTAGMGDAQALEALWPLLQGTLANVRRAGPASALTGPIARGDAATLAAHLEAIRRELPTLEATYRCLARDTLALARRAGLDAERAGALQRLIEGA